MLLDQLAIVGVEAPLPEHRFGPYDFDTSAGRRRWGGRISPEFWIAANDGNDLAPPKATLRSTTEVADMMTIHNFARGARGQRVMWLCEEMGLAYAVKNHPFPVPADYRALNPLGTLPFLEDSNGVAVNESVAIMLYIAQRYGPTPLLPTADAALMARCLQLTMFGETEIGMNLNPLLAAHFMAGTADKRNWSVIGLEQRVERAVHYAAALLRDRSYLVGDDLTLADISVSCGFGIWQGALGGQLPEGLTAYQDRLRARPAYQRARSRCVDGTN